MASQPAPFVLASVLTSYPLEYATDYIPVLLEDSREGLSDDLRDLILERVAKERLPDLQSEYLGIFDCGVAANPLYETEYDRRRALAKGNALSDIAGFYRAFGFELDGSHGGMEMLDHVGIELEFYSLLLMKEIHLAEAGDREGAGIVADARGKFLSAHLGRFVGAISRRPGVAGSGFYSRVFGWCADLIDRECRSLGLAVVPADWVDAEPAKEEEMGCAPGGACG